MPMKTVCFTLSVLTVAIGIARPAAAADGTIAGRVRNDATRAYLESASVTLTPGGRNVLTSRDGSFSFSPVPTGEYVLAVSYAGMEPMSVPVTLSRSEVVMRDIALVSGAYLLDKFVVAGEREGAALASQLQRNAPNVKNVLSSDTFGSVADENIGNFLLRVPGITGYGTEGEVLSIKVRGVNADMNSVTLDGTRTSNGGTQSGLARAFEIDKVPAALIDSIEITKAPTPDMDADSIGGSVNLKTKSPFNHRGRIGTYRAGLSYNTGRKNFRPTASLSYSDLIGKEQRIGFLFTASFNWASNPRDTNFGAWEPTLLTNRPAYFTLSSAGEDFFEHKRGGAGLRLDYKLSRDATVYLNLMYSGYRDRLFRRRNAFAGFTGQIFDRFDANGIPRTATGQVATLLPGWNESYTDTINQQFTLTQIDRAREAESFNLHVGGEQKGARSRLDYNFNFSPSDGFDDRTNIAPVVNGVGFRFDRRPTAESPAGAVFQQISGPDITNIANFVLPSVSRNHDTKREHILGGQVNWRRSFELPVPSYFQTGLRGRYQEPKQKFDRPAYNYTGPGGSALARFLDPDYTYQPESLRGVVPGTRFFAVDKIVYELRNQPQYFPENRVTTLRNELTSDRNASESVYAAYAMGGVQLGRLGILAGLRVEETHVEGTGNFQFISPEERARRAAWVGIVTEEENLRRTRVEYGNRRTNRSDYRNVFPGVHFKYDLTDGLQARLSYSTGIGRPNFGTIIPNDSVNDTTQRVVSNNTSLRPQFADNFDATIEYYFKPAGMLSAGVFLKEIKDFIVATDAGIIGTGPNNGFNGDYAGYTLSTQVNGGAARIRGLEIAYQQQFTSLPGALRGLGAYANYTWLDTIGDYGSLGATLRGSEVPGFIPRSGNVGLSYSYRGWMLRAQLNYSSRALGQTLNPNPALRSYDFSKRRLEFNCSYTVRPSLTIFVDVINALNESLGDKPYIYIPERKRGADLFNAQIKAGISGRF